MRSQSFSNHQSVAQVARTPTVNNLKHKQRKLQEILLQTNTQYHVDPGVSALLETQFDKFIRDMGAFFSQELD